jgi:flagellar hook-length control protein FliK
VGLPINNILGAGVAAGNPVVAVDDKSRSPDGFAAIFAALFAATQPIAPSALASEANSNVSMNLPALPLSSATNSNDAAFQLADASALNTNAGGWNAKAQPTLLPPNAPTGGTPVGTAPAALMAGSEFAAEFTMPELQRPISWNVQAAETQSANLAAEFTAPQLRTSLPLNVPAAEIFPTSDKSDFASSQGVSYALKPAVFSQPAAASWGAFELPTNLQMAGSSGLRIPADMANPMLYSPADVPPNSTLTLSGAGPKNSVWDQRPLMVDAGGFSFPVKIGFAQVPSSPALPWAAGSMQSVPTSQMPDFTGAQSETAPANVQPGIEPVAFNVATRPNPFISSDVAKTAISADFGAPSQAASSPSVEPQPAIVRSRPSIGSSATEETRDNGSGSAVAAGPSNAALPPDDSTAATASPPASTISSVLLREPEVASLSPSGPRTSASPPVSAERNADVEPLSLESTAKISAPVIATKVVESISVAPAAKAAISDAATVIEPLSPADKVTTPASAAPIEHPLAAPAAKLSAPAIAVTLVEPLSGAPAANAAIPDAGTLAEPLSPAARVATPGSAAMPEEPLSAAGKVTNPAAAAKVVTSQAVSGDIVSATAFPLAARLQSQSHANDHTALPRLFGEDTSSNHFRDPSVALNPSSKPESRVDVDNKAPQTSVVSLQNDSRGAARAASSSDGGSTQQAQSPAPSSSQPMASANSGVAAHATDALPAPAAVQPMGAANATIPHAAQTQVPPAPSTPQSTADFVPVSVDAAQFATRVVAKVKEGDRQFDIRLDPPELGRVDVQLSVTRDGQAQAHVMADKPQTLDALQRDQQTLHRALKDAGLDLGSNSLNFSLKGQDRGGDGGMPRYAPSMQASAATDISDAPRALPINSSRATAHGRLDIRV